jgi:hypothetical protein
MPRAKQLSAWVEDRPGVLGQVAAALGDQAVSIRAFMASAMDGRGFIRLVVDKPAAARKVLLKHGWKVTEDDVVEVTTSDTPGALGAVADRLGVKGVNIQYAYVGLAGGAKPGRPGGKVNFYLAVADVKKALAALK